MNADKAPKAGSDKSRKTDRIAEKPTKGKAATEKPTKGKQQSSIA